MAKTTSGNVVSSLSHFVADTFALGLKTQNYHWNVVSSDFYGLHKLFEGQYESLFDAVDELAERIRALGGYAPGGLAEYVKLASITDAKKGASDTAMLNDLMHSHEQMAKSAKALFTIAEASEDNATGDMMNARIQQHQKDAWMLRATLGK